MTGYVILTTDCVIPMVRNFADFQLQITTIVQFRAVGFVKVNVFEVCQV